MNQRKRHSVYSRVLFLSLLGIVLLASHPVLSQRFTKRATIGKQVVVVVNTSNFDLEIVTTNGHELIVNYDVQATAKSQEELDAFYRKLESVLENQINDVSSGRIEASMVFENMIRNNNRVTVNFKNDRRKYNLTELEGDVIIQMPRINPLNLYASFNQVTLGDLDANAKINVNSCKFTMGKCKALDLKSSFSKNMRIGAVNSAKMDLNSSDAVMEDIAGDLRLDASFSNVEAKRTGKDVILNLNSSSFEGGDISNLVVVGSFIRNLKAGEINKCELNLNSSTMNVTKVNEMVVNKMSFSTINVNQCNRADIAVSSSSKFFLDQVNILEASNCSFSHFKIGSLLTRCILKAQSGDLDIRQVKSGFETIDIRGNFLTANLNVESGSAYKLKADMTFPSYRFNGLQIQYRDKNHSRETIQGWKGNENNSTSQILIDCESSKIYID